MVISEYESPSVVKVQDAEICESVDHRALVVDAEIAVRTLYEAYPLVKVVVGYSRAALSRGRLELCVLQQTELEPNFVVPAITAVRAAITHGRGLTVTFAVGHGGEVVSVEPASSNCPRGSATVRSWDGCKRVYPRASKNDSAWAFERGEVAVLNDEGYAVSLATSHRLDDYHVYISEQPNVLREALKHARAVGAWEVRQLKRAEGHTFEAGDLIGVDDFGRAVNLSYTPAPNSHGAVGRVHQTPTGGGGDRPAAVEALAEVADRRAEQFAAGWSALAEVVRAEAYYQRELRKDLCHYHEPRAVRDYEGRIVDAVHADRVGLMGDAVGSPRGRVVLARREAEARRALKSRALRALRAVPYCEHGRCGTVLGVTEEYIAGAPGVRPDRLYTAVLTCPRCVALYQERAWLNDRRRVWKGAEWVRDHLAPFEVSR